MRRALTVSFCLAVSLSAAGTARADALSAATILGGFNAVVFGNFSTSSDVEGATVIGGDTSGASHTFNNNPRGTPPAGFGAVTVYGNASGGIYNVQNGDAYVGGTITPSASKVFNFNGSGSFLASVPNTIADFAAVGPGPDGLSASLAGLAANGTINASDNNNVKFNAGADPIAVFNVTAAELEGYAGLSLNLTNNTSTVIVNVDASGSGWDVAIPSSAHFQNESIVRNDNNVIWNFYNASSLSFGTQWGGVMLAPGAAVTNSTDIEGVLVAGSFAGSGEIHDYAFSGTLPAQRPNSVPEPGSLALLATALAAFGALGWTMKRARRV